MQSLFTALIGFLPVAMSDSSAPATQATDVPQWTTEWVDYDGDGLLDTIVLDPAGPLRLLHNEGDGSFRDVTRESGLEGAKGVTKALWQDYDRDQNLDVLLVSPRGGTELFRADGLGSFVASGSESGLDLSKSFHGARWFDYDNDGGIDLLLMSAQAHDLYRNEGRGAFTQVRLQLEAPIVLPEDRVTSARAQDQAEVDAGQRGGTQNSSTTTLSGGLGSPTVSSPGSSIPASLTCSSGVDDFSNPGSCIPGSTTPTLGMLYPLSNDWYIDGFGSVGLGTTSPTARLDVDGLIRSRSGGIEFPDGTVQTTATLMGPAGTDALWQVDGNHMNHAGGRVGIGNDDPQERLHVSSGNLLVDRGTSTNSITRTFNLAGARDGNSNAFATINLRNYDSGDGQSDYHGAQIKSHNATQADSGDLRISTNDGSGLTEAMRIDPDGKVGIGAANPTQTLDVDGTIRSRSGGFEFPDGSVQATAIFEGDQHTSIGPGSYFPMNGVTEVKNHVIDGVWVNSTGDEDIVAPIQLPHGASISGYTIFLNDTSTTDLRVRLIRKFNESVNSGVVGGNFDIDGITSGFHEATYSLTHKVNNLAGGYLFYISARNGDWPGNSTLAIQNIIIHWTME